MEPTTRKSLKKLFSISERIFLIIAVVFAILYVIMYFYSVLSFFRPPTLDVSSRLMSPDQTKTAFLIRRYAFDLNFGVTVIYGGDRLKNAKKYSRYKKRAERLFWSQDYFPYLDVNWNENIEWSTDSSFLKLIIHDPEAAKPFTWAYDFANEREITEANEIQSLWVQRNQIPDNNEVNPNQQLH